MTVAVISRGDHPAVRPDPDSVTISRRKGIPPGNTLPESKAAPTGVAVGPQLAERDGRGGMIPRLREGGGMAVPAFRQFLRGILIISQFRENHDRLGVVPRLRYGRGMAVSAFRQFFRGILIIPQFREGLEGLIVPARPQQARAS